MLTPLKKLPSSQTKLHTLASVTNEPSFKIRKVERSNKKLKTVANSPEKTHHKLIFLKGKTHSKR
jgi:hypothetical protein